MRLYWIPFCTELGTSWERPEYAYLNPKHTHSAIYIIRQAARARPLN